jgi:hypothetical protein
MSAYRISEVGFDKTETIFLHTTIEMASQYDIAEWLWVGDHNADVILVNSDAKDCTSKFELDKPTQTKISPILIGCSSNSKKCDSFSYTLEKPITYSTITTLLHKLELELAEEAQTSSPLIKQHDELIKEQPSSTTVHKEIFDEAELQPETHSSPTSHPATENEDKSAQDISIDVDCGYDINDLIIDSDFDDLQSEIAPTPNTENQRVAKEKCKTKNSSYRAMIYDKMNRLTRQFFKQKQFLKEKRYLGLIRKLALLGRPTEITHYIYPPVRIYPKQKIFAQQSYRGLSPELFSARASGFSVRELIKPEEQVAPDSWNSRPLWLLLYLAALYGSEGRLKENSDPHDRLRLISKPDFEMVPNDLVYRNIADFMITGESQDINTIANGSGVHIKTVIDFCNACEEIAIIDRAPSKHIELDVSSKISTNKKPETSASDKYVIDSKEILDRFVSKINNTK